jgi:GNAT superfamily N-acetyltransferase
MTVRVATANDVPALALLINSAYRGDSSKAGWTTEADLLGGQRVDVEGLSETIARPGAAMLVHEREGAPVACVLLERTGGGDDCYLGMLTVQPALQGAGLGRQLIEAAERWTVDHWGSRAMHMTVIAQRPELMAWYERRGYRRTGARKPFPYGDERFGVPRRDDLVFEVLRKELRPAT